MSAPASSQKELTLRGLILGVIITLVFTAANVFFGLKAGLTFAAVLHGFYDRFAESTGGLAIAGITIVLFAGYVRSSEEIAMRLWSTG